MEIIIQRGAGLDLHKKTVVATVQAPGVEETRTFSTMTSGVLALEDWLRGHQVLDVAIESTGVYWKPVFNLLERDGFRPVVLNAQHIKNVPGRKTDVEDSRWICELFRHGLVRPSLIPSKDQRECRELVTYRKSLVQERAREVNRVQKVLEGANIKLASVATDIMGVSGRAMLWAMINGETDHEKLAKLAKGELRKKKEALEESLMGLVGEHQRMVLRMMLGHIDDLDQRIAVLEAEIEQRMQPLAGALQLLEGIPGIGKTAAQAVLAVIGTDMSRFPTDGHLASWAGLSPGNNESAGKRKSGKTTKGNNLLRTTLVECAHCAGRKRDSYLSAQYHRIAARRGRKKAAVAVAHTILCIIYHMLKNGEVYRDLGGDYFDQRNAEATDRRLARRLERLGYEVTLAKAA